MSRKSKLQKSGKLNAYLGIKYMEKVMNNHIQGNYVYDEDVDIVII